MRGSRETQSEEDIQEFTFQINQLQLQQMRLERKLAKVQRRVESDTRSVEAEDCKAEMRRNRSNARIIGSSSRNNERTATIIRQQSERLYGTAFKPRIGDRVQIINPCSGQHPWGTIEGFCRDGKLMIHTDRGQSVT